MTGASPESHEVGDYSHLGRLGWKADVLMMGVILYVIRLLVERTQTLRSGFCLGKNLISTSSSLGDGGQVTEPPGLS